MRFNCKNCRKKFKPKDKWHIYQFCSHKCYSKFIKNKPSPRGRFKRVMRRNYWYVYLPDHPNTTKQGYFAEHRLIMEKKIGRYLKREEVVHHINEITTDNRIQNLQLFSSHGQHTKFGHPEHFINNKGKFKSKS